MAKEQVNCPNCGAALDWRIALSRLRDCDYCDSTILRDGDVLRRLGERGEMLDAPSLFRIGFETRLAGTVWRPIGHLRFSYGPGWWDEFWCVGPDGQMAWISVDEGDIVEEVPIAPPASAAMRMAVGVMVYVDGERFVAVEEEEAVCVAVRGELPEEIQVGETHRYVDFVDQEGGALTWEGWDGQSAWFRGRWRDPWQATLIGSAE